MSTPGGVVPDDLFIDFTEGDDNTSTSTRTDTTVREEPSETPEEGGYTRTRVPAREDDPVNTSDEDTTDTPQEDVNTTDNTTDTTDRDKPRMRDRAQGAAEKWGLDVRPPSFATEGLPPLNHSRSYARKGEQAANVGPARVAARTWDITTRPIRWTLRLIDHLLARPGRTLVAVALLALLARIEAFRFLLAFTAGLIDHATYWTGLQWLLGIS